MLVIFLLALLIPYSSKCITPPDFLLSPLIPHKLLATFDTFILNPGIYPQYTNIIGTWQFFTPNSWSSGFMSANLYALNERSQLCTPTNANGLGIADWLALGRATTAGLVPPEPERSPDHDRAYLAAFLEELAIDSNNATARTTITDFAKILAERYNPVVGCTRGWNGADPYTVLIDHMMSLEILMLAANITSNSTLRDMATSHANTTMKNHIRDDGSTWQIVEYCPATGQVVGKRTAQGYSDNSTWSRGQAWGIYGFANMFRLTGDERYLLTARRLVDSFIGRIPDDGIVPWDFDAPLVPAPRSADSSAASIAAAGLLLLAHYENDDAKAQHHTESAIMIINAITSLAWNVPWQSILSNATVNKPAGNALTGIMYGDYYYLKAGNELISRGLVECP